MSRRWSKSIICSHMSRIGLRPMPPCNAADPHCLPPSLSPATGLHRGFALIRPLPYFVITHPVFSHLHPQANVVLSTQKSLPFHQTNCFSCTLRALPLLKACWAFSILAMTTANFHSQQPYLWVPGLREGERLVLIRFLWATCCPMVSTYWYLPVWPPIELRAAGVCSILGAGMWSGLPSGSSWCVPM